MSNNMYDTYDDCKFSYYTPSNFDHRTREYLLCRYTPKAVWDYADNLTIMFNLVECPNVNSSILDSLGGKFLKVNFYNFRYELIPFESIIPAQETFSVVIDCDTSKKYFDRGTYYCSVKLLTYSSEENSIDDEEEIEQQNIEENEVTEETSNTEDIEEEIKEPIIIECDTLMPREYCSFYVQ